jgi:PAS domain S-box-containing protein
MPSLSTHLLNILDEIPMGVCLISRERKIVFMNRALEALSGFAGNECKGLPCSHVLRFNSCFENCPISKAECQERCVSEGDIINQDHQKIPVRVSFAPLRNHTGRITGYVETVEDLRQARNFDPARIHPFSFGRMIGRSAEMEKIFQFLPVIAQSESPVLIAGETGTGKDLLAEALHHASSRAKNAFVKFRCGALPDFLMESEIFGLEKGAFPGSEKKPGKFRLAQNGTLYLAEVGDLPPGLQAKLLNFLDEKTIFPLGGTKSFAANVRVIAATSCNLEQLVSEGHFRKDLYYRLNAVSLRLPPLKERDGDLRLLMDHFLRAHASLLNKSITGFSASCIERLEKYGYPGNVLELKHIVEYAVNLCRSEEIEVRDLPAYINEDFEGTEAKGPIRVLPGASPVEGEESMDWSRVERRMIMDALMKVNGRRSRAAHLLGWGRSTLWRKMKQYGIASSDSEN